VAETRIIRYSLHYLKHCLLGDTIITPLILRHGLHMLHPSIIAVFVPSLSDSPHPPCSPKPRDIGRQASSFAARVVPSQFSQTILHARARLGRFLCGCLGPLLQRLCILARAVAVRLNGSLAVGCEFGLPMALALPCLGDRVLLVNFVVFYIGWGVNQLSKGISG